jgi:hypothetical protein
MLVAALKFRFKQCEKKDFTFRRLATDSKEKRPHKAITEKELHDIYARSANNLEMSIALHLLYDLGGRLQDLLAM